MKTARFHITENELVLLNYLQGRGCDKTTVVGALVIVTGVDTEIFRGHADDNGDMVVETKCDWNEQFIEGSGCERVEILDGEIATRGGETLN